MRKYYYVCPRCGRCYKRYIPRRKAKCHFCSTVWKTRKAKGTRSAFSWTATLATIVALGAIVFFVGRELGVFPKEEPAAIEAHSLGTALEPSTESVETDETTSDAPSVDAADVENLESTIDSENAEDVDAAAE